MLRKRIQSRGIANGAITCLALLQQSKKAPSTTSPHRMAATRVGDPHQMRLTAAGRAAVQDLRRCAFERHPLLWMEVEIELARG